MRNSLYAVQSDVPTAKSYGQVCSLFMTHVSGVHNFRLQRSKLPVTHTQYRPETKYDAEKTKEFSINSRPGLLQTNSSIFKLLTTRDTKCFYEVLRCWV